MQIISNGYKLGYQKAAKIARHAIEGEFYLHSQLRDDVVKSVYATPISDLKESVKGLEGPIRVLIMPDAPMTVPLLR